MLELVQVIEQILRTPDRDAAHDEGSAAIGGPADDVCDLLGRILGGVEAVAIGCFDDDVISILQLGRWFHERAVASADIAGEDDPRAVACRQLNEGSPEDVSGP